MNNIFNVGDLVKIVSLSQKRINNKDYADRVSKIGVIDIVYENSIAVIFGDKTTDNKNGAFYFERENLKLVKQKGEKQFTAIAQSLYKDIVYGIYFNLEKRTTVVKWVDGTVTKVKCQDGDVFDKEKGVALCFMKKMLGNGGSFNNVFKKYIIEEEVVVDVQHNTRPIEYDDIPNRSQLARGKFIDKLEGILFRGDR